MTPFLRALLVALAVLGATPALAQKAAAPAPADKITITGDNFVVDDARKEAVFTGNVVVVQPDLSIKADRVVSLYGAAGPSSITSFEAAGHVVLTTPDQVATGDLAVFDPKTRMLTLTGNVVVTNPSGQVQSKKLVVNLKTKKSVFTNAGGRVTGVFNAE